MLKLFILFCLVNYSYSKSDEFFHKNLSNVKALVLQENTVNIYGGGLLLDNFNTCQINNLFYNNEIVNNKTNLKIVCKKHFYEYMICEKDLILFSLKINNYQKCKLIFYSFDNIQEIIVKDTLNIFKKFIYKEILYNCLRFFVLFLAVKFVFKIIQEDNIDFTNNIYTR